MRTLVAGAAGLLFALTGASAAIPAPQPLGTAVATLFATADADHDGVVTRAELDHALDAYAVREKASFETEWSTMLRVAGLERGTDRIDFPATVRSVLALCDRADTDHDGRVDPKELEAFAKTLPEDDRDSALAFMSSADRNADGTIDVAELDDVRSEIENYLAIDAIDPDSLPEGAVVTKASVSAEFDERAAEVRNEVLGRFERVSGTAGAARIALLQGETARVAEAKPAE